MPNRHEYDAHMDMQGETRHSNRESASEDKTPALEWIASAFGLLVVVGAFGLILYDAFIPDAPPNLRVETTGIMPLDGRYLVEVTVRNDGGSTAAQVNVEGTLMQGGKPVETASTTFDYVPAASQAEGGLFFIDNPRAYRLQLRADAYQAP